MDPSFEILQGVMLILLGAKMWWNGRKGVRPGTGTQIIQLFGDVSDGEKMKPNEQTWTTGWGSAMVGIGGLFLVFGITRLIRAH